MPDSLPFTPITSRYQIEEPMSWTATQVEAFLVEATWTLRRLPDKERAWIYGSTVMWPAYGTSGFEGYGRSGLSSFEQRRRANPTPKEIDRYLPILEWLNYLPDVTDRRVCFWACWHLGGEQRVSGKDPLPWHRVRTSLGVRGNERGYSRWALRRRFTSSMDFVAGVLTNKETIDFKNKQKTY